MASKSGQMRKMVTQAEKSATAGQLPSLSIYAYALMLWPLSIAQLSLAFVAPFYTASFGMSLSFVGLVLTIGRLLDVGADVGIAWASDRTRTRWGRRKPWVVPGLLLYIPATVLLFAPPLYMTPTLYVVAIMLFFLSWTTAFIPYLSQGTELTHSYSEKNRINVIQSGVMLTALLSAFVMPLLIVDPKADFIRQGAVHLLGDILPNAATTFLLAPAAAGTAYFGRSMLVITILSLAPMAITLPIYLLKVKDPPVVAAVGKGKLTAALCNPVFVRFAIGYLFLMAGYMGRSGLLPFILTFPLRQPNSYLFFMMLMFISSLVITPLWARLLQRIERIRCIMLAALIEAVGLGMLFIIPPANLPLTALAFIIMGLPGQTLLMVPYLIAADSSDYALWRGGADSRAIHISLCSLIVKVGSVFAGVGVWLAGLIGFNPVQSTQSEAVLHLLKLIGLGLPVLFLLVGTALIMRYPLDRRRHAAIQSRLRRRGIAG